MSSHKFMPPSIINKKKCWKCKREYCPSAETIQGPSCGLTTMNLATKNIILPLGINNSLKYSFYFNNLQMANRAPFVLSFAFYQARLTEQVTSTGSISSICVQAYSTLLAKHFIELVQRCLTFIDWSYYYIFVISHGYRRRFRWIHDNCAWFPFYFLI